MRLQVAIDRVNLKTAEAMIEEMRGMADIIEVGTSLIKDYGLENSVARFKKRFPDQCFLADIKTCDEGAYEFRKSYEAGGDIPTVMGFSSITTIRACAGVAGELGKEYMIDLLEVPADRIRALCEVFPEAIFCIHLQAGRRACRAGKKQCEGAFRSQEDCGGRRSDTWNGSGVKIMRDRDWYRGKRNHKIREQT